MLAVILVSMPSFVHHAVGGITRPSRVAVTPKYPPLMVADAQILADLTKSVDAMQFEQIVQLSSLPFLYLAARSFLLYGRRVSSDGYDDDCYDGYEGEYRGGFRGRYGRDDAIARMRRSEDLPPSLPGRQVSDGYDTPRRYGDRRYDHDDYYDRRSGMRGADRRRGPYEYNPGYDDSYGMIEPSRRRSYSSARRSRYGPPRY